MEPIQNFKDIGHYDVYSAPWVRPALETALSTWKPSLSNPFRLAQHDETMGLSTVIYHPGVEVPDSDIRPRDVANMVVYLPNLMERAAWSSSQSLNVFLYDKTNTIKDGTPPQYLSALEVLVDEEIRNVQDIILISDTPYEDLQGSTKLYFESELVIANKVWALVATPVDGTFEAHLAFVWFGGILIFVASLLLAIWMIHNMYRSIQVML